MSAEGENRANRSDLDLSFLERQQARAAEIPNLNDRGERIEEREPRRGGRFVGTARVETATISGRFDGDLDVSHALRITASGKVTSNVVYGRLEIEQGGEVLGDVRIHA